jgi:pimeloyl-ACP methyl ester carboxylesterase
MLRKFKKVAELLQDKWRESRAPPNAAIFSQLRAHADGSLISRKGIHHYLEDYLPLGEIKIERDWYSDDGLREMRLDYVNSLFAPGCLRFIPGKKANPIIVFLPGNVSGADDVLRSPAHPQYMAEVAANLGCGIACWDWPLQGLRRSHGLYESFRTVISVEREYSRILPSLGTCLWREMVAELQFALTQLTRLPEGQTDFHVIGWSMGASFAFIAPLLARQVRSVVAAGSCASIRDLLGRGETRVHGYFFYPLNGLAYFDLEDTVERVSMSDHCRLKIIFGERDPGCFAITARTLSNKALELGHPLELTVLPDHGHEFSTQLKEDIIRFLTIGLPQI